jgi:hypothetical protein
MVRSPRVCVIPFGLRFLRDTLELGQRVGSGYSFNVITIIIELGKAGLAITLSCCRWIRRTFAGDTLPDKRIAKLVKTRPHSTPSVTPYRRVVVFTYLLLA